MHAYLVVGSTPQNREEKVKELLSTLEVAEFEEQKTDKKHLIATIRALNKRLLIPAVDPTKNRAIIIHDAHLLTQDAANAFLKTLEEPPQNTIFILTAPQRMSVLETIASRAQTIELTGESIEVTQEDKERSLEIFKQLTQGNLADKMKILDSLSGREEGVNFVVGQILEARELLNKNLKQNKSTRKLVELLDRLDTTRVDLEANVNAKIALSDLIMHYPSLV